MKESETMTRGMTKSTQSRENRQYPTAFFFFPSLEKVEKTVKEYLKQLLLKQPF